MLQNAVKLPFDMLNVENCKLKPLINIATNCGWRDRIIKKKSSRDWEKETSVWPCIQHRGLRLTGRILRYERLIKTVLEGSEEDRLQCTQRGNAHVVNCKSYVDMKRMAENRAEFWVAANKSTD